MPYASKAQQRAMHAKAERGEISERVVHEYDEATKHEKGGFKKLPERAHQADKSPQGHEQVKGHEGHFRHPMHGARGSHEQGGIDVSEMPGEKRKGSRA